MTAITLFGGFWSRYFSVMTCLTDRKVIEVATSERPTALKRLIGTSRNTTCQMKLKATSAERVSDTIPGGINLAATKKLKQYF